MKQMNHHEVYVTQRINGKKVETPLSEFPELAKRVKAIEKQYKVRVTHCTYSPNRKNLLTMKYEKNSDGDTLPVAA